MRALALTCGDPGGIGPEIAIDAWLRRSREKVPPFYILADPLIIKSRSSLFGEEVACEITSPAEASECFADSLPIVPLGNPMGDTPGQTDPANAAGIIEAIDRAVADTASGNASGVVTLPIAKKTLHDAGFAFPGHTEYLAHLAAPLSGTSIRPVMMMAGPELRTVPVTVHVAFADVLRILSSDLIAETCRITAHDLEYRFGIDRPRLAVAALNPHAGEAGSFGNEEDTIIRPALERLGQEGITVTGPLPADTMFHPQARKQYDAAICMYHDQALIPAKAIDFARTVNVTLGLPFVRTSPDHGTAFDIAGTGRADPQSLIEALKLAAGLASNDNKVKPA